jgi:hypothetical protein
MRKQSFIALLLACLIAGGSLSWPVRSGAGGGTRPELAKARAFLAERR